MLCCGVVRRGVLRYGGQWSGALRCREHLKSGDHAGIFSRLPLSIVKVCGHSNDCAVYWLAKESFGISFELSEHHGTKMGVHSNHIAIT